MTAAEVEWLLERVGETPTSGTWVVAGSEPVDDTTTVENVPLYRVDADNSLVWETDEAIDMDQSMRSRKRVLQQAAIASASLVERPTEPVGTEYDEAVEAIVSLRVEGLHHHQRGYIDPAGEEGIQFPTLVREISRAIKKERTYPGVQRPTTTYHSLTFRNAQYLSDDYSDFYLWTADAVFDGYDELP